MSLINPSFSRNYIGWGVSSVGGGSVSLISDGVRLNLSNCGNIHLIQDFVIDGDTISFDWNAGITRKWGEGIAVSVSVDGVIIPVTNPPIYSSGSGPTSSSGQATIDMSAHIGKTASIDIKIVESIGYCSYSDHGDTYMSITNLRDGIAGKLDIMSTPPGAEVYIDGVDQYVTTPIIIADLYPREHAYKLTLADYYDITGVFNILSEQVTTIDISMTPLPSTGDLDISSIPPGAEIYIDGADQYIITPSTITGLSPGTHSYKLTLAGYFNAVGSFYIFDRKVTSLNITMTEIPRIGDLDISSIPNGAQIYINNTLQEGIVTPNVILGMVEGSYELRLTLIDYQDYIVSFNIVAGETTVINADMIQSPGSLYIESIPTGARIYVDNIDKSVYTPSTIYGLSSEILHTYRLTLDGYYDANGTFNVLPNITTTMNVSLDLMPLPGTLQLSSSPSGAVIYIDDEDIGMSTPAIISNILEGTHTYKLVLNKYYDVVATFDIIAGYTTIINVVMKLLPQPGSLEISSIPSGASIHIDGKNTGVITPARIEGIIEGPHTYRLILSRYYDNIGEFTIVAGATTNISKNMTLLPASGSLDIVSTPVGASIYINDVLQEGILTPAIITDLAEGTYAYKLVLDGYHDFIREFYILAGQITTIDVVMNPIIGNINIISDPPGASIYIDNILQEGIITPTFISGLTEGVHTYKLVLDRYHDATGQFTIVAGTTIITDVALMPTFGDVNIISDPFGASIYIDNVLQEGIITPAFISGLTEGVHTYKLVLNGYYDTIGEFTIISGITIDESTTLIVITHKECVDSVCTDVEGIGDDLCITDDDCIIPPTDNKGLIIAGMVGIVLVLMISRKKTKGRSLIARKI